MEDHEIYGTFYAQNMTVRDKETRYTTILLRFLQTWNIYVLEVHIWVHRMAVAQTDAAIYLASCNRKGGELARCLYMDTQ